MSFFRLFGPPDVNKLMAKGDINGLINLINEEKDDQILANAVYAIGELKDSRAVRSLIIQYGSKNEKVRENSFDALKKIGRSQFIQYLSNHSYSDADNELEILARLGGPEACEILFLLVSRQKNRKAAEALAKTKDPKIIPRLIELLNGDCRELAKQSIINFGSDAIEPLLTELRKETENKYRGYHRGQDYLEEIVKILTKIGWTPTADDAGAAYYIVSGNYEKCILIGDPAIDPLIGALRLGYKSSINALIKINSAVKPLIQCLKDPDDIFRERVAGALGQFHDPQVIEPLRQVLFDNKHNVQWSAFLSLANLSQILQKEDLLVFHWARNRDWERCVDKGEFAVIPLIIVVTSGHPMTLRFEAAIALGHIGDNRAVQPIIELFEYAVANGMGSKTNSLIKSLGEIGDPLAIDTLLKLFPGSPLAPEIEAMERIQESNPDAVLSTLLNFDHYQEYEKYKRLIDYLKILRDKLNPCITSGLLYLLESNSNENKLLNAAEALCFIQDTRVIDLLIRIIDSSQSHIRGCFIADLGQFKDPRVFDTAIKYLDDNDAFVRTCAVCALRDINDIRMIPALTQHIHDPDLDVRYHLVKALGVTKSPLVIKPLIEFLKDPDKDVRVSAVKALGGFHDPRIVKPLTDASADPDYHVSKIAKSSLRAYENASSEIKP